MSRTTTHNIQPIRTSLATIRSSMPTRVEHKARYLYSEIMTIYVVNEALLVSLQSYCPIANTREFRPASLTRKDIDRNHTNFHPRVVGQRRVFRVRHSLPPEPPVSATCAATCCTVSCLTTADTQDGPLPKTCCTRFTYTVEEINSKTYCREHERLNFNVVISPCLTLWLLKI